MLKNLDKEDMQKELQKIKEKVEKAREAQDKYIKEMQANCPHKETIETVQNNVKYIFCKDCLKRLN
ncbi:MAG: hypothetical protein ACTSO9_14770 [Candidatus Helarchaeota archaeon]